MISMERIRQAIVNAGFNYSGDLDTAGSDVKVKDSFIFKTAAGEIFDLWITGIDWNSDDGITAIRMEMWKEPDRLETGTASGWGIYNLTARTTQAVEQWIHDHVNEKLAKENNMSEKLIRSIEQREYLADKQPTLEPSDMYMAPHFVKMVLPLSERHTNMSELSRDQVQALIPQMQQWLADHPDQDTGPHQGPEEPQVAPKIAASLNADDIGRQVRFNYVDHGQLIGALGTITGTLVDVKPGVEGMNLTFKSIGHAGTVTINDVPLQTIIVSYPM